MDEPDLLAYHYTFVFDDGRVEVFQVRLERENLSLRAPRASKDPDWTRLEFRQCSNCPLDPKTTPRCPIAVGLAPIVERVEGWISHEEVDVTVTSPTRRYQKRTSLQVAISSLVGIYTVTAGCPILDRFRPMVDTHLPFSSPDEATYRFLSMYLFTQWCLASEGHAADWQLEDVDAFLSEARVANAGLTERLRSIGIQDAGLNALAILNAHGELTRFALLGDDLERWRRLILSIYPAPNDQGTS